MASRRQSFGKDTGLQARMLLTLFLLGLLYAVFVGVLFAAGAGGGQHADAHRVEQTEPEQRQQHARLQAGVFAEALTSGSHGGIVAEAPTSALKWRDDHDARRFAAMKPE